MTVRKNIPIARRLRRGSTEAEHRLWSRIRARQIADAKFVRQFPIGDFIVDFCCRSARLIVEVDGGQHDDEVDLARTDDLSRAGYVVMRFWNNEVIENIESVLETIGDMIRIARNG